MRIFSTKFCKATEDPCTLFINPLAQPFAYFHSSFTFCSPLLSLLQRWPSSSAIWPFPLQPSNPLGQHPRWMRDSSSALVLSARGSAQVAACRQASLVSMTEGESTGWARVSRLLFRPLTCVIIFLAAEQTTVTDN